MECKASLQPSPTCAPGTARRIRIEEWTYDLNTGNCVKFRTVDKTVSSSKLRRKFHKTWNKAKSRFQNSIEDFGNKLRFGGKTFIEDTVEEITCEFNESGSSHAGSDTETPMTSDITSGNPSIKSVPRKIEKPALDIEGEEEVPLPSTTQNSSTKTQKVKESPLEAEEKESDDEKWFLPPMCSEVKETLVHNKSDDGSPIPGSSVAAMKNEKGTLCDSFIREEEDAGSEDDISENAAHTETEINSNSSEKISVVPKLPVTGSVEHLPRVLWDEAYFDLSTVTYDLNAIEKLIHEAKVLSYQCHGEFDDQQKPKAITVLGTYESISRLRDLLESYDSGYNHPTTESRRDTETDLCEHYTDTNEELGEKNSFLSTDGPEDVTRLQRQDVNDGGTSNLLSEMHRVTQFLLEKASENVWENITEEEMLKVMSALHVMSSKVPKSGIAANQRTQDEVNTPETCTIDIPQEAEEENLPQSVSAVSDKTPDRKEIERLECSSFQFGNEVSETIGKPGSYKQIEAMIRSDSLEYGSLQNQTDSDSIRGNPVEDCMGDGFSNSISMENILSDVIKKEAFSSSNSIKSLTSQITGPDNIRPCVEAQEIYVCTCLPSNDSSRSNDINVANHTDSSPAHSTETALEEARNLGGKLQYFVSHCGPFPSMFEVKFEEDVDCEISRCSDQWRIHFGEKAPSEDGVPHMNNAKNSSNPEIYGKQRLFTSSSRHFELSFNEDSDSLRISTNVQDPHQQKHKDRKLIRKSATTM